METIIIRLSENEIERLINGESVSHEFINGQTVVIEQNLMKDIAAPIINRDKKVFSNDEIENIKSAARLMADTFKLGY